jgi:hypothetical protein
MTHRCSIALLVLAASGCVGSSGDDGPLVETDVGTSGDAGSDTGRGSDASSTGEGASSDGSTDADADAGETTSDGTTSSASSEGSETTGPPPPAQPELPADLTSGFINVFWYLPATAAGYDDVALDIHPDVSGPDDGTLQYFAFGGWQLTQGPAGAGFYGGLQTRMGNQTPASGYRGVIFSAWGVVDAIPHGDAYVDVDKVSCDGGVGAVCVQLSLVYDWTNETTYRMHYRLAGDAPGSPGNQLLRASITDLATNQESILGDVIVPISWGKLPAEYYSFDETFPEPEGALCTNYNPSDVTYTNLMAQSGTVTAESWTQADPAYAGPCIDLFHYDPLDDGYRMRLGIYVAP